MTGNPSRVSVLVAVLLSLSSMLPHAASAQSTTPASSTIVLVDAADYATGSNAYWVAAGDFRGIGTLDLAVANAGSWTPDCTQPGSDPGSVSILLGNGDGTFQKTADLPAGQSPSSVAVGQFTTSGHLDLVVANACDDHVSVFLGNGDGTFQPAQNFPIGPRGPLSVAVGQFTNSGHQDLVTANFGVGGYGTVENTISVLLGNGDGTFQPPQTYTLGTNGPYCVAVGNFTASGQQDLVVTTLIDSYAYVLLGNGDGTFQAAQPLFVGFGPACVAVGTFTSSGHQDLAVTLYGRTGGPGAVAVLLGNGDGSFQAPQTYSVRSGPIGIAIGDFNGSGIQDLAVASWDGNTSHTISVLMGNGDGTFQAPQEFPITGTGADAVAVGDFDANGTLDVATSAYASGTVSVLKNITVPAATPVLSPPGGTFGSPVQVTITDSSSGATVYYTTDGTTPTHSSTRYTAPIMVTTSKTIKAIATAPGFVTSAVASGTYTIAQQQVAPPVFSPAGGTYVGPQTVTLSDPTPGAAIHYTTDGSTPTTASPVYSGPLSVTTTTTIKAMAAASGMANSSVASATYTIMQQVATPTLSPGGGTYVGSATVTLSDATPGATIHYTTDGSTPTTSSAVYGGALTVTTTTTIKAMAAASGMANSGVASATYTITLPAAAAPTFSPSGGNYLLPLFVSISDASPGATIYYTTDGSMPTTASNIYTGPILVVTTTTINAIAAGSGWSQSPMATATYSPLL
jgi:hypothetical protein